MLQRFDRNAKRVGEIIAILGRYGLADWLSGLDYEFIQGRLVSFDGERLGKLAHRRRARRQARQDRAPGRIGQGRKGLGELIHI